MDSKNTNNYKYIIDSLLYATFKDSGNPISGIFIEYSKGSKVKKFSQF